MVVMVLAISEDKIKESGNFAVEVDYRWGESNQKFFKSYNQAIKWLSNQYGVESVIIEKQISDD